ncbi:MAG: PQQ-dependent sugar dehydrogenase [Deltaproteobacteria bacterium]|nr:PQQ-dependent sugar dehydrogenase [Deltaproteobacteria bacterium]
MKRALLAALLAACGGSKETPDAAPIMRCDTPIAGSNVQMQLVAQVNGSAILVTAPRDDLRLFIIEQTGSIRIMDGGALLPAPFLDLSADASGPVTCCGERGMLGLAFHPQYATNGLFFVTYTAAGANVLARCSVSALDSNKADRESCVDVLSIPDFASNHNGGMIEFGPDGFLYWATGDGGGAGDPNRNGQALQDGDPLPATQALLGKMLRIDVDTKTDGLEYGIPSDNPFAGGGGKPEIFMIGLRNAWRWTFDRATGDMWIADVGQGQIEEVTVLRPSQQNGANLGWSSYEGNACFRAPCDFPQQGPQNERFHNDGWTSITGGQVYRGSCFPDLAGTYFYTDYDERGRLATAKLNADDTLTVVDLPGTFPANGSSIHEDAAGELYETDTSGRVFQLVVIP